MYLSAITYVYIHVCMLYILHISCMSRQLLIIAHGSASKHIMKC